MTVKKKRILHIKKDRYNMFSQKFLSEPLTAYFSQTHAVEKINIKYDPLKSNLYNIFLVSSIKYI